MITRCFHLRVVVPAGTCPNVMNAYGTKPSELHMFYFHSTRMRKPQRRRNIMKFRAAVLTWPPKCLIYP
jgi:hypothetical protein